VLNRVPFKGVIFTPIMKQILSQIFILFAAIGLLTTGCAKILGTMNDFIYSTSFEKYESMDAWEQGASAEYKSDAPTGGGNRSLYVSGGCVVPHMILDMGKVKSDNLYSVSFFGKVLANGGFVQLYAEVSDSEKSTLRIHSINRNGLERISLAILNTSTCWL
jgi:hypothetical protein